MKKRSLIVAALCSMCLAVSTPMPVMADASKVVTLGADLTDEQKNTMMKYFKADANQVQIITVNNQDERNYLGKYISSEQIGTRTLSCAYVKPTQSGGIKVRTANLNYVTCNMLANALSTAGISNCEAVAACPYEVSGTGALTGVMMAYESASGKQLDSTKKDLATKEVVVTGDVAKQVGGDNATNIINQAKLQIIGDNVQNADEIYNIVNNIAVQNNVSLSSDELTTITALLQEIVQQNYDIQDMKQTLESIQQNLNKTSDDDNSSESEDDMVDEDNSDGEDITEDVNTDVLGDDVKESYTEDAGMAEATGMTESENGDDSDSSDEGLGIPDATEDGTQDDYYEEPSETPEETDSVDGSDSSSDDGTGLPEENGEETGSTDENYGETTEENTDSSDQATTEGTDDALNTDSLDDASKAQFEQAKQFCQGEYKGDLAVLQAVVENAQQPTVTLDADTADKLTRKVLEAYLNVLKDGGVSYVPADTDVYMTAQLNMINNDMKKIFSIETEPAADDILVTRTADERQTLYNDTMKFFEKLYGETTDDSAQQESAGEASYDEESYNEESYNEETYNEETY
ncbi:DUF1002 domain-containing protein [Blautia sp. MSK17_66]|uniref:DUF1002 domain-containing protein n=1 Tax=Blautia TaxID=572511 RepID=UPI00156DEAA7|nr:MULTISPECIES: DUF1002 domain-containing protein [Blautia]MCB5549473.1 DUF1002 domain-containing protein [Blautia sp. MSK17_66]NSK01146.1 DUF1002 domain-containing protein [Blautia obeum]